MKIIQKITLIVATVLTLAWVQSTQADGVLRSPKLASQQTRTVTGPARDPDLAHPGKPQIYWTPKMAANLPRIAARSAVNDPDLAHPQGLVMGGKDYDRQLQARGVKGLSKTHYELAPLK